jgi:hypothetical protein
LAGKVVAGAVGVSVLELYTKNGRNHPLHKIKPVCLPEAPLNLRCSFKFCYAHITSCHQNRSIGRREKFWQACFHMYAAKYTEKHFLSPLILILIEIILGDHTC